MSLKLYAARFYFLFAIPFISGGQTVVTENGHNDTSAIQRQEARKADDEERRYLQVLNVAAKAQSDRRPAIYRTYLNLASLNKARYQYTEAEKYYELACNIAKTLFGEQSEEVATTLNRLGEIRLRQGRVQDADWSFHRALTILESGQHPDGIQTAAVLNNLAVLQHRTGNLSRAAVLMRKVVGIFETGPAANEECLGTALSNLATMLRTVGTPSEALTTAQRAVSILERYKDTDSFAVSLVTLSRLHMDNGDTARAETMLQRALRSIDNLGQEESPTRALIFGHLGVLYGSTGRHSDAESYFQRAIEMNRRVLGPTHSRVLDTMGAYADFLRATKRKGEAKKLEQYVRTQRENYRLQNPSIASVVDVRTLMRQGDR